MAAANTPGESARTHTPPPPSGTLWLAANVCQKDRSMTNDSLLLQMCDHLTIFLSSPSQARNTFGRSTNQELWPECLPAEQQAARYTTHIAVLSTGLASGKLLCYPERLTSHPARQPLQPPPCPTTNTEQFLADLALQEFFHRKPPGGWLTPLLLYSCWGSELKPARLSA